MTKKMTGEPISKKIDEDWSKVEEALQQFEKRIGLGGLEPSAVTNLLTLTPAALNKMSVEDCAEGALLLSQEATYIQSQLNMLQSKMDWCKRRIDKIIAPIIRSQLQRYMDASYKRALAIKEDDVADRLQAVYDETASYHSRLSYLPTSLRSQADKLSKYQETKRGQNYG
jgi:hypothetical protein